MKTSADADVALMGYEELKAQARSTLDEIERRLQYLEQREQHIAAMDARMRDECSKCADKVRLNVGGRTFETAKSNLLRFDSTYFQAMLSSGFWQPDSGSGAYFIDASPRYFDHVMDLLRGEALMLDGCTRGEAVKIRSLLEYFHLPCPDALLALTQPNNAASPFAPPRRPAAAGRVWGQGPS
jgi:hypothetical protein